MKPLREYQIKAIDAVKKELDKGINKQLLVMATGTGKTFTAVKAIEQFNFQRVLWITHTEELVQQSALAFLSEKFDKEFTDAVEDIGFINWVHNGSGLFGHRDTKFRMGLIKADAFYPDGNVVMASAQTLHRRLDRLPKDHFDAIVCDEAHLFLSRTFSDPLKYFEPKLLLGLTATPTRLDGMQLGNMFDKIVYSYDIADGIKDGYLCELDAVRVKTDLSLDNVRTTGGEFNAKDLSNEVDIPQRNKLIVDSYKTYAEGRQGIFFCVDIKHSLHLAEEFKSQGIICNAVSSDEESTGDRSQTIKDFKAGKIQVLTNVGILTTGFDHRNTGVVGNCAPTKSLSKYLQCLDDKTEILTNEGWKNINNISKKHKVAAYDKNTQEISFEKIINVYKRDRGNDEDMYSISLPEIDIRVTSGHRMLIANKLTRKKILEQYKFETAEDFSLKRKDSVIPISGYKKSKGLPLTNDELVFIGLFLSDGSINKRKNQLHIAQSAHQKWNKDIIECLNNCGIKYKISSRTRSTQYSENSTMNYYFVGVKEFRNLLPWLDKNLNSNFNEITPSQLEFLVYGINLGDGDKTVNEWKRRTYSITTGNIDFANNLQILCIKNGMKCSLSTYRKNHHKLHIKPNKQKKHISFCNDGRDIFKKELEWKKEKVWCVENIKSTLITRRNGKVSILGNCIGRGTRLKDENFVAKYGQNCVILDFVDSTTRHKLINAWSLDSGKATEEKVFMTKAKKKALIDERERKIAYVVATSKKDVKVDLFALPKVYISNSIKMEEPATEKQLAWIARLGYDTVNVEYTKKMCSEIISAQPATEKQIGLLKWKGYDVSNGVTISEFKMALNEIEKRENKELITKHTPNNNGQAFF